VKRSWAWALLGVAMPALATLLDFSAEEQARIVAFGPWPPVVQRDPGNRVEGAAAAIELGRQLFRDEGVSASGRLSCASCHVPGRAFQDGRRVARGARNTPGLLDAGQRRWYGWDGAHDSLWSASLAPLLAGHEIAATPSSLVRRLNERRDLQRRYVELFGAVQPGEVVAVNVAKALAAYQATLVSPRTTFDDFRDAMARGDRRAANRYPLAAQRGLRLFIGSARCNLCHAGPAFSNGEFADIGLSFFVAGGVDSGRWGGLERLLTSRSNRLGEWSDAGADDLRAIATQQVLVEPRHFGEFRVPGLRQLAFTAPYMHDGSLATLEDVVRHYSELDEDRLHADGQRVLRPLKLAPRDAADLAAFLRSLSAPSAAPAGQRRRAASRRRHGSPRWPRRPDRHSCSAHCRKGASDCLR
jgi:cytochrome c peroxidase